MLQDESISKLIMKEKNSLLRVTGVEFDYFPQVRIFVEYRPAMMDEHSFCGYQHFSYHLELKCWMRHGQKNAETNRLFYSERRLETAGP